MTVELSIKDCDLLGVLSQQPYVGFELIRCDGLVSYSTSSARRLLYCTSLYNPTNMSLVEIEGELVGQERTDWVEGVCRRQRPKRFEFVRLGCLMTSSMWPIRSLPTTPDGQADAVLAMVTRAITPSTLLLSGHFTPPNPLLHVSEPRSLELSGTSRYASWGHLSALTPREREVLVLIGLGLSQKDIAEKLQVTAKTIETHRMRLGKKLDITTGGELVRIAYQAGIGLEHAGLRDHTGAHWMNGCGQEVLEDSLLDAVKSTS